MPLLRKRSSRRGEGYSDEKSNVQTPLKRVKIFPSTVNITRLNDDVKSNTSIVSTTTRLENLKSENEEGNKENEELQVSSDLSDWVDSSDEDEEIRMERFMKQRNRIRQTKQDVLRQLAIVESTKEIRDALSNQNALKKAKNKIRQRKFKSENTSPPQRRLSLRLLRKDPCGVDLPLMPETYTIEKNPRKPGAEFQMDAVGFVKDEYRLDEMTEEQAKEIEKSFHDYENFMKSMSNIKDVPDYIDQRPSLSDLRQLESLKIRPEHVRKVTKSRIFSLAIHPSLTEVLIAAGDKEGNLGLWRPLQQDSNDSTYMFKPHVKPISCMKFSLFDLKLYMCSYDGQLRTMDLARSVFDETIIDDEDIAMSGFDFLESANTLIASRDDGCLSIVDTRAKGNVVQTFEAHHRATKCVSCHPLQKCYVSTSHRDGSVFIFDVRKVMKCKNRYNPVVELKGHCRSTSSAYFSPLTGKHILTTSYDNHLRVFDTSVITTDRVNLKSICNHDNQTGRWLCSFRAVWQPNTDDSFAVGSMNRPRQIDLYNDSARPLHILSNPEVLTNVCSINCFHDTRNILAGGASGGKVFMFYDGL